MYIQGKSAFMTWSDVRFLYWRSLLVAFAVKTVEKRDENFEKYEQSWNAALVCEKRRDSLLSVSRRVFWERVFWQSQWHQAVLTGMQKEVLERKRTSGWTQRDTGDKQCKRRGKKRKDKNVSQRPKGITVILIKFTLLWFARVSTQARETLFCLSF